MMRASLIASALLLLPITLSAACSNDPNLSDGSDGSGSKASANDGQGGEGSSNNDPFRLGDTDVVVSSGNDDDSSLLDADLVGCKKAADCCDADEECKDEGAYICTVDGFCGSIEGSCEENSDCQGDTYCCEGELCRGDGSNEGVCISAAIPPGLDCGLALEVGEFAPDVQCEWVRPEEDELEPDSMQVLATPLVIDLPYDSGAAAELVIVTAKATDTPDASAPGVIRILNGQDCTLLDSIKLTGDFQISALATPAIGDVNGDGQLEIAVRSEADGDAHHLTLLKWNGSTYVEDWSVPTTQNITDEWRRSQHPWAGPSLHDLDNDGKAEVLLEAEVWKADGTPLFEMKQKTDFTRVYNALVPIVADVDGDGTVELLATRSGEIALSDWDAEENKWVKSKTLGGSAQHLAFADFGTASGSSFDPTTLDGKPEIVGVEPFTGVVTVRTLAGVEVLSSKTTDGTFTAELDDEDEETGVMLPNGDKGGPPVIGDFDADGFPEIGVAGSTRVRVFDFDCAEGCPGESEDYVLWSQPSQDSTSGQTGGTLFDFDGDGKAEMVYADECFLRVYAGNSGEVLFSAYRTSTTWLESPLVADIDRDENTELVINSNNFNTNCPAQGGGGDPYVDPIHPGVKCSSNETCPSGTTCGADGLCKGCSEDADCCDGLSKKACGLTCADRVAGDDSDGKVCRATHPGSSAELTGVRVLRDRLDRWASSRSIWNQHAYSITNVKADGSIPTTSNWEDNWAEEDFNNFRANVQGVAGFDDLPDITGRLADGETCVESGSGFALRSTVCNRGKRAVGADLPATFYIGDPKDKVVLCTSYTDGPVPTGGCKVVQCAVAMSISDEDITVVVNDDGEGRPKTVECRSDNNTDVTSVKTCNIVK